RQDVGTLEFLESPIDLFSNAAQVISSRIGTPIQSAPDGMSAYPCHTIYVNCYGFLRIPGTYSDFAHQALAHSLRTTFKVFRAFVNPCFKLIIVPPVFSQLVWHQSPIST